MGGRDATERPTYWRRDKATTHEPSEGAIVLGITSAALATLFPLLRALAFTKKQGQKPPPATS